MTINNTLAENAEASTWQNSIQSVLDLILTNDNSVIIYICLVLGTIIITLTRSIAFFKYCAKASVRLHNLMFDKIVYAPMRFFNINPPGRVLNRFSKDIGAVDELLPLSLLDTLEVGALNDIIRTVI